MDVTMPDGAVVQGVPDGITKSQLLAKYQKFSGVPSAPKEPDIISRIGQDWKNRGTNIAADISADQTMPEAVAQVAGNVAGAGYDVLGEGVKSAIPDVVKRGFSNGAQDIANAIDSTDVGKSIGDAGLSGTESAQDFAKNNPRTMRNLGAAANLIGAGPLLESSSDAVRGAAPFVKNAVEDIRTHPGGGSGGGIITSIPKPPIDPRVAQLVQNASDLDINIPARVFYPGAASNALTKAGLMSGDNMKSEVTSALSKVMGHEGTPNLDIDTMNGIQNNIGGRMNDFAFKADAKGGIPVATDALEGIAEDSEADASAVAKKIEKIKNRLDENGNLSGDDYKELTQKGGTLDRGMNSSDLDLAQTSKELRNYLDDRLQNTVHPDDLTDFQNARRQYRTMKVVQPIVESGGVTGQADSASKLFNAVVRDYGSIQNALKYNPDLGRIAQIVNEFPETVKESPQPNAIGKIAALATAPAALGVGAVGGIPAGVTAAAALPIAKGTAMYLGSAARKTRLIGDSLPKPISSVAPPPLRLGYAPLSAENVVMSVAPEGPPATIPMTPTNRQVIGQSAGTVSERTPSAQASSSMAATQGQSDILHNLGTQRLSNYPAISDAEFENLAKKQRFGAPMSDDEMLSLSQEMKRRGFKKGGSVKKKDRASVDNVPVYKLMRMGNRK